MIPFKCSQKIKFKAGTKINNPINFDKKHCAIKSEN